MPDPKPGFKELEHLFKTSQVNIELNSSVPIHHIIGPGMSEILWQPSEKVVTNSEMTAFSRTLERQQKRSFPDYRSLHQWSIDNLEAFWESYLDYSNIRYSTRHEQVLDSTRMPGARWFSGMTLNYAENLLQEHSGNAIISVIENDTGGSQNVVEITYDELRRLVARCVRGLRQNGIKKGDRVAGYLANVPEAIIACLACASMGAVWSSASPDFGLEALCDRFAQVQPKLVFASSHYSYGGKTFRTDDVVKMLKSRIPAIETIITIPYPKGHANLTGDLTWDQFLGTEDVPPLTFEYLPFEHPLFILFSSGTTGAPKCIVHGTGGTLVQHRKELQLHSNLRKGDKLLFFTTCGWMMWNWQLSALSLGATVCLYDGNPGYPDLTAIWRTVKELDVTHYGTSGRFLESCMKSEMLVSKETLGDLPHLAAILYTGSPLSENGFRWVYENIKQDVHLAGISGGTDIVSCFVLGNPNLPVYAGEIQCKGLGVDIASFNENGESSQNGPGELVCRKPLPSMPIEFLNDPNGQKYHEAYFDVYPGIWRHGDFVQFTKNNGIVIFGRSDATLNPGGVRIGSAEIYSALDEIKDITGSVVVGWRPPNQSDEVIVLFVVLASGQIINRGTQQLIQQTVRKKCSPRHVPQQIFQISEIPVTRSGKTVELSVKATLAKKTISNRNALANPEVLQQIEEIRQKLLASYS